jgi:hypothetical protein
VVERLDRRRRLVVPRREGADRDVDEQSDRILRIRLELAAPADPQRLAHLSVVDVRLRARPVDDRDDGALGDGVAERARDAQDDVRFAREPRQPRDVQRNEVARRSLVSNDAGRGAQGGSDVRGRRRGAGREPLVGALDLALAGVAQEKEDVRLHQAREKLDEPDEHEHAPEQPDEGHPYRQIAGRSVLEDADAAKRHERIEERPDEDARRRAQRPRPPDHRDDARGVRHGAELQHYEEEREDDAGEGHHPGGDRLEEGDDLVLSQMSREPGDAPVVEPGGEVAEQQRDRDVPPGRGCADLDVVASPLTSCVAGHPGKSPASRTRSSLSRSRETGTCDLSRE